MGLVFFFFVVGMMDFLVQWNWCQWIVVMVIVMMVMIVVIGFCFWFEGCQFFGDVCFQFFQYFFQYWVFVDVQEIDVFFMVYMCLGVMIVEVEGVMQQQVCIGCIDVIGCFGFGDDFDYVVIIVVQQVVIVQYCIVYGEYCYVFIGMQGGMQVVFFVLVIGQFQFVVDLFGLGYFGIESEYEKI